MILKAKKSLSKTPEGELLKHFSSLYRDKIGEQYPPSWGRDLKMFKNLLGLYPKGRLERLLSLYFEEKRDIYSIPYFKLAVADLVQKENKVKAHTPHWIENSENWRYED
jgi:hypothetical protein